MATESARVQRWQRTQVARGWCRECGNKRQPGSRCPVCLEQCRRATRRRRGIRTVGQCKRGRPLLGSVWARRRNWAEEEARKRRRRARRTGR